MNFHLKNTPLFLLLIVIFNGCSLLWIFDKDSRQYQHDLKHQVIPAAFVNSTWRLLTISENKLASLALK